MMTVNIKIELNNLDKAMTEILSLKTMVLKLAETYPTKFTGCSDCNETTVTDMVAEVAKETTAKAPTKAKQQKAKPEPTPEVKEPQKPALEVAKQQKAKPEPEAITLAQLTAVAKDRAKDDRAAVKAVINKFAGKLSEVDERVYPELLKALEAL